MQDQITCLFETEGGIATGHVKPYCSTACTDAALASLSGSFVAGHSSIESFGYVPQCEHCGKYCADATGIH